MNKETIVLVVLSGGQDSATCLAWAKKSFDEIHTISFDYGQRHIRELDYAKELSQRAKAKTHREIPVSSIQALGDSSLLDGGDVTAPHPLNGGLPSSFVPGRNLVFLTLASAHAYKIGAKYVVTGVCQTDFSGYPDCRAQTISAIELAINLGITEYKTPIKILTPLMYKTKAETVLMMQKMGCLDWYAHTHTCYKGEAPPCGECPACLLRAKGFAEAGIKDPLVEGE
uniref:7-cyano-7-deazaguanine synthase n=1 Tax=viral metagenome TaxID=1070528 RepID=A0A6M3XMT7_9ZZZZ